MLNLEDTNVLRIPPFQRHSALLFSLIQSLWRTTTGFVAAAHDLQSESLSGDRLDPWPSAPSVKSIQNIMRQDTGVDGDAQRISQLCWMFFLKIIDDQDQELELMQARLRLADPRSAYQWRAWAADPEGITGEELLDLRRRRPVSRL